MIFGINSTLDISKLLQISIFNYVKQFWNITHGIYAKYHTTNHAITYTNNIAGKITECWLVNEECIFSSLCFVKGAKLLAHDWSSGCLATAYSIEKLFFCHSGVSCGDSWRGVYRRIKGQEWEWKHEE